MSSAQERAAEAVACLRDAETALRIGNAGGVVKAIFIWSQRRRRILAGEETWAEQRFDPTQFPGVSEPPDSATDRPPDSPTAPETPSDGTPVPPEPSDGHTEAVSGGAG